MGRAGTGERVVLEGCERGFVRELVGRDFPAGEARRHARAIRRRHAELEGALGRPVRLEVAALDYFSTLPDYDLRVVDGAALERLTGQARTDVLTGVLNRRGLEELLERERARARRSGEPLAVLVVDLDAFKGVNDRHGHLWGDRVLARVADQLVSHCRRGSDAVGRLGGDEFALVLPGTTIEGAHVIAERVRAAIAEADLLSGCPTRTAGERVTVSIGVSNDIARADMALYQAKREGRDRACSVA